MRPSEYDYFIKLLEVVRTRSTCVRRKVGAIAVKDGRVIATGYNGSPRGTTHCTEDTCLRLNVPSGTRHELCRAVHAEQNLVAQAALHGVSLKDAVVYVDTSPCGICAKLLVNAGVKEVYVQGNAYPDMVTDWLVSEGVLKIHYRE